MSKVIGFIIISIVLFNGVSHSQTTQDDSYLPYIVQERSKEKSVIDLRDSFAIRQNIATQKRAHRLSVIIGRANDLTEKIKRFVENHTESKKETTVVFIDRAALIADLIEIANDTLDNNMIENVYVFCPVDKKEVVASLRGTSLQYDMTENIAGKIVEIAVEWPDLLEDEIRLAETILAIGNSLTSLDVLQVSKSMQGSLAKPYKRYTAENRLGERVSCDEIKLNSFILGNAQFNINNQQVKNFLKISEHNITYDDSVFTDQKRSTKSINVTVDGQDRQISVELSHVLFTEEMIEPVISRIRADLLKQLVFVEFDDRPGRRLTLTDYGRTLVVSESLVENPELVNSTKIVEVPSRIQFEKLRREFPVLTSTHPIRRFVIKIDGAMQELDVSNYEESRVINIGLQSIKVRGEDINVSTAVDIIRSLSVFERLTLVELEILSAEDVDWETGDIIRDLRITIEKKSYLATARAPRLDVFHAGLDKLLMFTLSEIDLKQEGGPYYKFVKLDNRLLSEKKTTLKEENDDKAISTSVIRKRHIVQDKKSIESVAVEDPTLIEDEILQYVRRKINKGKDIDYVKLNFSSEDIPAMILVTADENDENNILLLRPGYVSELVALANERKKNMKYRDNIEDSIGLRGEISSEKSKQDVLLKAFADAIDKVILWLRYRKKGNMPEDEEDFLIVDEEIPVLQYAFSAEQLFEETELLTIQPLYQIEPISIPAPESAE